MRRLALFARWPRPFDVKTRLSPALPAPMACELYRAMLADSIAVAAGVEAGERLVYWANAPATRDGFVLPAGFGTRDQRGADLGERVARAFGEMLLSHDDRAVIVGIDCPALESGTVAAALDALDSHDVALGPARDGGYYLVGLARFMPALFEGVAWGTERVLEQTLDRAASAGLRVARLEMLADLDTPEDLLRWIACRASGAGPREPRALDQALRAIGLLPPG